MNRCAYFIVGCAIGAATTAIAARYTRYRQYWPFGLPFLFSTKTGRDSLAEEDENAEIHTEQGSNTDTRSSEVPPCTGF